MLGPYHPHTAISLNNLGSLLQDQGDLAAGRSMYDRALSISEKVLGPNHTTTTKIRNNLKHLDRARPDSS